MNRRRFQKRRRSNLPQNQPKRRSDHRPVNVEKRARKLQHQPNRSRRVLSKRQLFHRRPQDHPPPNLGNAIGQLPLGEGMPSPPPLLDPVGPLDRRPGRRMQFARSNRHPVRALGRQCPNLPLLRGLTRLRQQASAGRALQVRGRSVRHLPVGRTGAQLLRVDRIEDHLPPEGRTEDRLPAEDRTGDPSKVQDPARLEVHHHVPRTDVLKQVPRCRGRNRSGERLKSHLITEVEHPDRRSEVPLKVPANLVLLARTRLARKLLRRDHNRRSGITAVL